MFILKCKTNKSRYKWVRFILVVKLKTIFIEKKTRVSKLLVDTAREYTWINEKTLEKINVSPEKKDVTFVMANGQTITRTVGFTQGNCIKILS